MRPKTRYQPAANRYWIGYCRKSTDSEDKQVFSLEDQQKLINDFYAKMPLEERAHKLLVMTESKSAFKPNNRPKFREMMDMAEKGQVHGVIVFHPNRISRNPQEAGEFQQKLADGKIEKLVTTDGRVYTRKDSGTIMMLILEGAMSWKDSKDKGQAILRGMRGGAERGNSMGPTRLGYNRSFITGEGGKIIRIKVKDEVVAPLILRLFQMASAGVMSISQLTRWAARNGLKTRKGKPISKSEVHRILRDPYYKGTTMFEGIENKKAKHPAIVDEPTWERVQLMLDSRNKNTSRHKSLTLRDLFILGNLVKCGKCGHNLSPYRVRKANGKEYVYYECKTSQPKCGVCIPQNILLTQLREKLSKLDMANDAISRVRQSLLSKNDERMLAERDCRKELNKEYEDTKNRITQMISQRAYAQEAGCVEELDAAIRQLRIERDQINSQLNGVHQDGNVWIEKVMKCFELVKMVQETLMFGSWATREAMLKAIASNYCWDGEKLVWDLRSPYREAALSTERPEWWSLGDSNP